MISSGNLQNTDVLPTIFGTYIVFYKERNLKECVFIGRCQHPSSKKGYRVYQLVGEIKYPFLHSLYKNRQGEDFKNAKEYQRFQGWTFEDMVRIAYNIIEFSGKGTWEEGNPWLYQSLPFKILI